jgi:hypothetical protein
LAAQRIHIRRAARHFQLTTFVNTAVLKRRDRRKRSEETKMAHVYFHCSNPSGLLLDRHGSTVQDLTEVRECAARVVHAFISTPGPEDWRDWTLQVSDEEGEEILQVPFVSVLGRPH